jgi:hypothetical protein
MPVTISQLAMHPLEPAPLCVHLCAFQPHTGPARLWLSSTAA